MVHALINLTFVNSQILCKKFLLGISTEYDLKQWETVINALNKSYKKESIIEVMMVADIENLFIEYLLKHFPNNQRLIEKYKNVEKIHMARKYLYRTMLVRVIAESLPFIRNNHHLIDKVSTYIKIDDLKLNGTVSGRVIETKVDSKDEELFFLLKEIGKHIPSNTKKEQNWHFMLNGISSFIF